MDIVDPRIDPRLVPPGSRPRIINGPRNEYRDLPSVLTPNGYVITRWSPTPAERAAIARGEDVYVTLVSGGLTLVSGCLINPMFVTIGPADWNT